jgi:hypothetical protein
MRKTGISKAGDSIPPEIVYTRADHHLEVC